MKLRLLAAALTAITLTAGAATAQDTASEKGKLSYALGYDLGRNLVESGEQVDLATVYKGVQDGFGKKQPTVPVEQLRTAVQAMQQRQLAKAKAQFDKASAENKTKSDAFLAANKGKPGVTVLPSGVQYRVIEAGAGAKPTTASTVQMHYRGSISTGQEFANTYAQQSPTPASFKVGEFPIKGVRDVLMMMPTGARWEIFLPADQAFGNDPRSPVGPAQALVFDIKLVRVQ